VQERRVPVRFRKKPRERLEAERPDGPGKTQGRTGGKQAMGFLLPLDGKTLKHAKTTEAENGVR